MPHHISLRPPRGAHLSALIALGAGLWGGLGSGAAFAVELPTGFSSLSGTYLTLDGEVAGARLGQAVTGGGDFNGDGFDDVAVSAPGEERVYVLLGAGGGLFGRRAVNVSIAADVILELGGPGGASARHALSFTDFDDDGFDDLLVGQPSYGGDLSGRFLVVYGHADWGSADLSGLVEVADLASAARLEIFGDPGDELGFSLVGGRNFNESSNVVEDALVGAPGVSKAYALKGIRGRPASRQGSQPLSAVVLTTFVGEVGTRLGASVAQGPQFTNPGSRRASILLGDPFAEGRSGTERCGVVYAYDVVPSVTPVSVSGAFDFVGVCDGFEGEGLAGSALLLDDLDGGAGGYSDMLVAAPGYQAEGGASDTGLVFFRSGSQEGPSGIFFEPEERGQPFIYGAVGEGLAFALAAVDLDGDGLKDTVLGSPVPATGADWASANGQVYLFLSTNSSYESGASQAADLSVVSAILTGSSASGEQTGAAVAGAGNPFGSPYEPLVIGAPSADRRATDAGRAYVYVPNDSVDLDGDGFTLRTGDCNEGDPGIHTSAVENTPSTCDDGIDQNCDGVDTSCAGVDLDGDGYSEVQGDCDETNPGISPAAQEVCDEVDGDCDGAVDEFVTRTYYEDFDQDGYGNPGSSVEGCVKPEGYLEFAFDCDDFNENSYPGATEVCDLTDNDCDEEIDEGVVPVWYQDNDEDGYGNDAVSLAVCSRPGTYVLEGGDCDDEDPSLNPQTRWYPDQDGDTFGDDNAYTSRCIPPDPSYILVGGDCDDVDSAVFTGAEEICDRKDSDCDGVTPPQEITNADGDPKVLCQEQACEDVGIVNPDSDPAVYPGNGEVCLDKKDNDCDGTVDEGEERTYYKDADGDSFVDPGASIVACGLPAGYQETLTEADCDDGNPQTYPGATELCEGRDNDCDGSIDEGLLISLYDDRDADGYGDPATETQGCPSDAPDEEGIVDLGGDCDDTDPDVNPGEVETCGGADEDCDGVVDEGVRIQSYPDVDQDGYGDVDQPYEGCEVPPGNVTEGGDCDDGSDEINPGAQEICDGEDNDCDGDVDEGLRATYFSDGDGDGYGDPQISLDACEAPFGYVGNDGDCDDQDASSNPEGEEVCDDGADNDCDGTADEDCDGEGNERCGCGGDEGGSGAALLLLLAGLRRRRRDAGAQAP